MFLYYIYKIIRIKFIYEDLIGIIIILKLMSDLSNLIYMAKIAEQTERYEDMI